MNTIIPQERIDKLIKQAQQKAWCDDPEFMVDDWAGGNIDDAYAGGYRDGDIILSRFILDELGIEYKIQS